jgi:thioesterase domain-containing protein
LAGYSSGGVLAYAVASRLVALGESVSFIGLIDVSLPCQDLRPQASTAQSMLMFHLAQQDRAPEKKALLEKLVLTMHELTIRELIAKAKQIGLIAQNVNTEQEALTWEQARAFESLYHDYRPDPLPVPIHLFYATEPVQAGFAEHNLRTSQEHDPATTRRTSHPTLGWERILHDSMIRTLPIPGNHFTMVTEPAHRAQLGAALSSALSS